MRYCPTCQTKYDDDKIRFCTKDGTSLVSEQKPVFTDKPPSESVADDDDLGEVTVIRRKKPEIGDISELPSELPAEESGTEPSRIVINTSGERRRAGGGSRTLPHGANTVPPRRGANIFLVIFLTVAGTLIVVGAALGVIFFLTYDGGSDENLNLNVNENINANLNGNIDDNYNANDLLDPNVNAISNVNANANSNADANLETPTPSPSPTPSLTPEAHTNINAIPLNANVQNPANTGNTLRPSPTENQPTSTPTPLPPPANLPTNTNRPVNIGTINGRALTLPLPAYPQRARAVRAAGRVVVQVTLDEFGRVIAAKATSGHPFLRRAAENAALRSRFRPAVVNGKNVKASGKIFYNFVN